MPSRMQVILTAVIMLVAIVVDERPTFGIAGSEQVAEPGKPVTPAEAAHYFWPIGTLELINDLARTTGWNSWSSFSEPMNEYLFQVRSTEEANRIIRKFAEISATGQRIVLLFEKEARSIVAGQNLPTNNGTGAVFRLQSQRPLEDLLNSAPRANSGTHHIGEAREMPPITLCLYIGNKAIDLTKLDIPPWVEVLPRHAPPAGYVERLRSNGLPEDRFLPELRATQVAVERIVASRTTRPKSGKDVGNAKSRVSLREAIKAFNKMAADDLIGCEQTPLTEPEIVAAIRIWKREKDSPVSEDLYQSFKQIAETTELPAGAEFEVLRGIDPGGDFIFEGWWVRIQLPKPDGGSYSFSIRDRVMRSIPIEQKLEDVELSLEQWPRELPGRSRLEEYHQELKRRVETKRQRSEPGDKKNGDANAR